MAGGKIMRRIMCVCAIVLWILFGLVFAIAKLEIYKSLENFLIVLGGLAVVSTLYGLIGDEVG